MHSTKCGQNLVCRHLMYLNTLQFSSSAVFFSFLRILKKYPNVFASTSTFMDLSKNPWNISEKISDDS